MFPAACRAGQTMLLCEMMGFELTPMTSTLLISAVEDILFAFGTVESWLGGLPDCHGRKPSYVLPVQQ